ncbi:hypothetical protein Q8A67_001768 [Cirrhinus molitorella]|uniref:Uncharacterized protein n=1 Tax=Cirrhinus molitorella TaxID=172907 RepID=A0AA88QJ77_9TELE|nr:hypothetical protein Q8A67_001768 [Cirrhinus molitorella]
MQHQRSGGQLESVSYAYTKHQDVNTVSAQPTPLPFKSALISLGFILCHNFLDILRNRPQTVMENNEMSCALAITAEVLQGSLSQF